MSGHFIVCGVLVSSRKSLERRLWAKVIKTDGCWLWTATKTKGGYGKLGVSTGNWSRMILAHRIVWELTHGSIPAGLRVLHTCDNPACCNPAHLFLGTAKDNTRDMLAKEREARGERHGHTKLTEEGVREMRRMHRAGGLSLRAIGQRFGVWASAVWKIVTGRRWKHVPD